MHCKHLTSVSNSYKSSIKYDKNVRKLNHFQLKLLNSMWFYTASNLIEKSILVLVYFQTLKKLTKYEIAMMHEM